MMVTETKMFNVDFIHNKFTYLDYVFLLSSYIYMCVCVCVCVCVCGGDLSAMVIAGGNIHTDLSLNPWWSSLYFP